MFCFWELMFQSHVSPQCCPDKLGSYNHKMDWHSKHGLSDSQPDTEADLQPGDGLLDHAAGRYRFLLPLCHILLCLHAS